MDMEALHDRMTRRAGVKRSRYFDPSFTHLVESVPKEVGDVISPTLDDIKNKIPQWILISKPKTTQKLKIVMKGVPRGYENPTQSNRIEYTDPHHEHNRGWETKTMYKINNVRGFFKLDIKQFLNYFYIEMSNLFPVKGYGPPPAEHVYDDDLWKSYDSWNKFDESYDLESDQIHNWDQKLKILQGKTNESVVMFITFDKYGITAYESNKKGIRIFQKIPADDQRYFTDITRDLFDRLSKIQKEIKDQIETTRKSIDDFFKSEWNIPTHSKK